MEYGSHTDEILLEPNSEFQFSLKSDDTYLVDIDLETTVPTSGITATIKPRYQRKTSFQPSQLSCSAKEIMPQDLEMSVTNLFIQARDFSTKLNATDN